MYHHKTKLMLAIGMDNLINNNINFNENKKIFNICYAGNLLNLKGLSIILGTFNQLKKTTTIFF